MDSPLKTTLGALLVAPSRMQETLASLSRGAYFREASLDMMLAILTESVGQLPGIGRVSIWALTDDQQELRCLEMYERATGRHGKGRAISAVQYPVYFSALREEKIISVDDADQHVLTMEFGVGDRLRHGITAFLDTPIHIRGELQGMLCLEQIGLREPWGAAHRLFAQAVANLVTLALVQHEAQESRLEAHAAREHLRAVYDASREALSRAGGPRRAPDITIRS